MATIKDYFEELPEPYKTQAIKNSTDHCLGKNTTSLGSALCNGFIWSSTEQGHNYWRDFLFSLEKE